MRAEPTQDPRDLVRPQLAVVGERIARAAGLPERLLGVLDGLDPAVDPSTSKFLRSVAETISMNQPLTPRNSPS
ncbi:hypothetical protein ACQP1G_23830 [Nocardia sp. CA-107356]|uniref:hypothetical protein n=1 Tax=Nocardia sp. CA-107356 TaxID=3239972 RepID=UPI003D902043